LLDVTLPGGDRAGETASLPTLPIEVDGEKMALRHDLPAPGQQSTDILQGLGYSVNEIAQLKEKGVL